MGKEPCKKIIDKQEVINIHQYVIEYFLDTDPIHPGINNEAALEMAVEKPFITGCPDRPKYFDEYTSAAALSYGLTKSHAFFDGNKRTSMVVLLAYLDALKLQMVSSISHDDLYQFMIHMTTDSMHRMPRFTQIITNHDYYRMCKQRMRLPTNIKQVLKGTPVTQLGGDDNDTTIFFAALWLKSNTRKRVARERRVTLRELRQILEKFDMQIEQIDGTRYRILRPEEKTIGIFRSRTITDMKSCATIHSGGDARLIGIDQIKLLRKSCGLTDHDYYTFYGDREPVDTIIAQHASVLSRLAKYDRGK